MSRDRETTFRAWAKPPSDTEEQKCENAERMIRDAIRESSELASLDIEVLAQGSYKNDTNVRLDSDVDICVVCRDPFFFDFSFADGFSEADTGIRSHPYTYYQFRADVEKALVAKFGRRGVTRGNKAFDVHENSYRVDADVVACFEHRRYTSRNPFGGFCYESGTEFVSDSVGRIINWPRQHYANGVAKNQLTGNRFKRVVRILKRLRNEMSDQGIAVAKGLPSHLIECLVWNVPNDGFNHDEYAADVRCVLAHAWNETISDEKCCEWREVSQLKYLFHSVQPWTREQAHAFLYATWGYVGFE